MTVFVAAAGVTSWAKALYLLTTLVELDRVCCWASWSWWTVCDEEAVVEDKVKLKGVELLAVVELSVDVELETAEEVAVVKVRVDGGEIGDEVEGSDVPEVVETEKKVKELGGDTGDPDWDVLDAILGIEPEADDTDWDWLCWEVAEVAEVKGWESEDCTEEDWGVEAWELKDCEVETDVMVEEIREVDDDGGVVICPWFSTDVGERTETLSEDEVSELLPEVERVNSVAVKTAVVPE